jgi:hypothetical protein
MSINQRVAAANAEASSLKEKLGLASRTVLTSASAGFAGLNNGVMRLKTAANEALQLNKDAAGLTYQVTNSTRDASQVCNLRAN